MWKLKLAVGIILSLVLTTISIAFFLPQTSSMPLNKLTLKIVLNQTSDFHLSLSAIDTEQTYSSDYQLNIPENFYLIKIFDSGNNILFSGKVSNVDIIYPAEQFGPNISSSNGGGNFLTNPSSQIVLYLPFYLVAKKIVFYDQVNNDKLDISLNKLTIPNNYIKSLCGNGICDFNENIFSCPKDCLHF